MHTLEKIENFLHRAVVISFCALIFFLPISIALVGTCSAFAIFFFLIKKTVQGFKKERFWSILRPRRSIVNRALVIHVVAVLVSVVLSKYFELSAYAFVGKFLRGYLLYLSFIDCFTERKYFGWFAASFLFSGFWISLSGIYQYFGHPDFIRAVPLSADRRVSSCMRHANDFGAYLIILCSIAFVSLSWKWDWFNKWRHVHIFYKVSILVALVALGLTFSRSAWIGLAVSLFIIGLFMRKKVLVSGILLLFFVAFLPTMQHVRNVSFFSDDLKNGTPADRAWISLFGGNGRLRFWEGAIKIIRTAPAFGTGLNTYSVEAPKFDLAWTGYPHNCYLQMAAEIGILGLLTFLFVIWALFRFVCAARAYMPDPFLKSLAIATMAGLIGFFLQSFFDTTFYSSQLNCLMWIMIGLVTAAVETSRKLTKQRTSL